MKNGIIVTTTTDNRANAEDMARMLIDRRLAACVQITGPVTSVYRWKGEVEQTREWQCVIKSRADLFNDIAAVIRAVHAYETPEIIAVPIIAGSRDYLDWMATELAPSKEL